MEFAPRLLRQPGICIGKGIQISVFTLFVGCCGVAAPIAPPGEELSAKLTEVECGRKSHGYCTVTGLFLCPTFRRSTSDLASLGHLLPGRRYAPAALKRMLNCTFQLVRFRLRWGKKYVILSKNEE